MRLEHFPRCARTAGKWWIESTKSKTCCVQNLRELKFRVGCLVALLFIAMEEFSDMVGVCCEIDEAVAIE